MVAAASTFATAAATATAAVAASAPAGAPATGKVAAPAAAGQLHRVSTVAAPALPEPPAWRPGRAVRAEPLAQAAPLAQAGPLALAAWQPGRVGSASDASLAVRVHPPAHARSPHPGASDQQASQHGKAARHHKARHHKARHHKARHHKARHHKARHHKAAHRRHRYRIYDSVNPASIPARRTGAVYSNGRYFARPSQLHHLRHVLWIDVTGRNYAASVLDVEPGDATPAQAANWAWHRLRTHHRAVARIYTMRSEWPATRAAIARLPWWMRARVRWWIADPTGVPHIVRGSHATQWKWGKRYDVSLAKPGF